MAKEFSLPFLSSIAAVLVVGVFVVFGRSLTGPFLYDDRWTIVENKAIDRVLPATRFFFDRTTVAVSATGMGNSIYRPLVTLSFAIDNALGGRVAPRWRAENFLLHSVNGFLFFMLLVALGTSRGAAFLGAAAFLYHPAQVETVAWVTQRSNLLCGTGILITLLGLHRGRSWALAGAVLALLSKESAVPALLLTPFFLMVHKPPSGSWRTPPRRTALLAILALSLAYLMIRFHVVGSFAQRDYRGGGLGGSLLLGAISVWEYAKILLWPVGLRVSHRQYVDDPFQSGWTVVGLVTVALIVWITVKAGRRDRRVLHGVVWGAGLLAPVLGLFATDTFVAERFLYLPLLAVGGALAFAWDAPAGHRLNQAKKILLATVVGAWAILSSFQAGTWRDELTLWTRAVEIDQAHGFARACRAQALERIGRTEEADEEYRSSLQNGLSRDLAGVVLMNLARLRLVRKDYIGARAMAGKARIALPGSREAFLIELECLARVGDSSSAVRSLDQWEKDHPGTVPIAAIRQSLADRRQAPPAQ